MRFFARPAMKRTSRLCGAFLLLVMACDSSVVEPAGPAPLALLIQAAEGFAIQADRGGAHIEGPTSRVVSLNPGVDETILGLTPGSYRVAIEGFVGSEVESFGQTNVTVVADQTRRATVNLASFTPRITGLTPQSNTAFDVEFTSVPGAVGYLVEWASDPSFAGASSEQVSTTSLHVPTSGPGQYAVRVRALTEYNSNRGIPSAAGFVTVGAGGASPIHVWTFSETGGAGTTLIDQVGGRHATIADLGPNDAVASGGRVTLSGGGGSSSDYIDLPDGILSGLTSTTIELWATHLGPQSWARIFDFGSDDRNYLFMSWTQGTGLNSDRVEWASNAVALNTDNTVAPYAYGAEYHIVMTIAEGAGSGGSTLVRWFRDGQPKGSMEVPYKVGNIPGTNLWLGRSQYQADEVANASYNELRIYPSVLSDSEIAANAAIGPTDDGGPPASGLVVTPSSARIGVIGVGLQLGVLAQSGTDPNPQPTWSSSNPSVVSVGPGPGVNPVLTTVGPGVAVITATSGSLSGSATIVVSDDLVMQTTHGGHTYAITRSTLTWAAAQDLAASYGGHLVVFEDDAEVQAVAAAGGIPTSEAWIGYSDARVEGEWEWLNTRSSAAGAENWAQNEPNDAGGEDCASIFDNGEWNDLPCTWDGIHGVVEFDFEFPLTFAAVTSHGGHTYATPTSTSFDWFSARDLAQALGGHLWTINDQAENDAVAVHHGGGAPFIGLSDSANEGVFLWANGEPLNFENWQPGEPNDAQVPPGEDCVHIGGGQWNDLPCWELWPVVFEFPGPGG